MKGELAGRVFQNIQEDFREIKEAKLKITYDQFNTLLTKYARSALEVTVVQSMGGSALGNSNVLRYLITIQVSFTSIIIYQTCSSNMVLQHLLSLIMQLKQLNEYCFEYCFFCSK